MHLWLDTLVRYNFLATSDMNEDRRSHALLLATCSHYRLARTFLDCFGPRDELPPHWDLDEIARQRRRMAPTSRPCAAGTILEDDRPLRLEACLVLRGYEGRRRLRWRTSIAIRMLRNRRDAGRNALIRRTDSKYWPGLEVLHAKRFERRGPVTRHLAACLTTSTVKCMSRSKSLEAHALSRLRAELAGSDRCEPQNAIFRVAEARLMGKARLESLVWREGDGHALPSIVLVIEAHEMP